MAIAVDTSAVHSGTSSFSYTCTGANLLLIVAFHWVPSTASSATSVTYAGAALTRIGSHLTNATSGSQLELWYLVNPATGSNTFAYTNSGTTTVTQTLVSYTGVNQSTPLDGTETTNIQAAFSSSSAIVTSVTTSNANSLVVSAITASGSFTTTDLSLSAGTLEQNNTSGTGVGAIGDKAAPTAGSNSIQWNRALSSSRPSAVITQAINAAGAAPTNTSSGFFAF